jgi:hypothetical protein
MGFVPVQIILLKISLQLIIAVQLIVHLVINLDVIVADKIGL